ncbi:MAG: hypothetical protein FJ405_04995 [Verrucomicrobia bacterium]|nr:hypothetical protein [Verrucomicrobiota bacterium]
MSDEWKKAWQSQSPPQRLTLDPELLLNEVRRNERQFASTISWRDVREVAVSLLLVPVWVYLGVRQSLPWSWYVVIPALVWVAGFMLVDRARQCRHQPAPGDDLYTSVKKSLAQVEHQILLLRNIHWWYLLPIFAALMVWPVHHAWNTRDNGWLSLAELAGMTFTFLLVFGFIYWLNQYAVRKQLIPRQQELQALLEALAEPVE